MSWTPEKPTVGGYYWHRRHANSKPDLLLVDGDQVHYTKWPDEPRPIDLFNGSWCGPLEAPP